MFFPAFLFCQKTKETLHETLRTKALVLTVQIIVCKSMLVRTNFGFRGHFGRSSLFWQTFKVPKLELCLVKFRVKGWVKQPGNAIYQCVLTRKEVQTTVCDVWVCVCVCEYTPMCVYMKWRSRLNETPPRYETQMLSGLVYWKWTSRVTAFEQVCVCVCLWTTDAINVNRRLNRCWRLWWIKIMITSLVCYFSWMFNIFFFKIHKQVRLLQ